MHTFEKNLKQAHLPRATCRFLGLPTLTLLAFGFLLPAVQAGFYWTNTLSRNWSSAANWTNDTGLAGAPVATGETNYVLNFNRSGTYTATNDLNNGFLLNQFNFGGPTLTLRGNDLAFTNNGVALPQINQNSNVTVTVNNNVFFGTNLTLVGTGSGPVILSGLISGSGALIKNSTGTLTLNKLTNTYSGGTVINAGTVGFAAGNGSRTPFFGTGPVTINSPATLALNRTWLTNHLTLNGGTVTSGNSSGSTLAGPITLAATPTFNLTNALAISGTISGTNGFLLTGSSTVALSGSSTFAGPVVVNAGTLSVDSFNRVSGGTPDSSLGAPTSAANGTIQLGATTNATLLYTGPGETTDRIIQLAGATNGITLAQGGTCAGGIPLTQSGQSGLLKFISDLSIPGSAGTDNRKILTLANLLSVNSGYLMGRGEFAGAISDSVLGNPGQLATSLTMVGPGYWTLSGSNSYTGITAVQAGILIFIRAAALGTNALNIANGAIVELDFVGTREIGALTLNGVAQPNGTYGSSSSIATTKDDIHFAGLGTLTIGPITSPTTNTLTLSSGANPSSGGASLTFTATLIGSNAPSGNVVFYDGLTVLGTNTLNGSFQAAFTTSFLTGGVHSVTALYLGNASNAPSASATLSQTVVDSRPTTTMALALTAGANPSGLGAAVTFTATVTGATPTGLVTFYNGTTAISSAPLNGSAQASFTTASLPSGWNGITALYPGDANNAPSVTAAPLWQTVKPPAGNGKLKVFILAGQSNMQGKGRVEIGGDPNNPGSGSVAGGLGTLRRMLNTNTNKYGYLVDTNTLTGTTVPGWRTLTNVWVSYFTGTNFNNDIPSSFQRGKGYLDADFGNFTRQGMIGPEYGFGLVVGSQLGDPVLIIKNAWGGRSLKTDWRPPSSGGTVGSCYTNMVANVYHTLSNLSSEFTNFNYNATNGYEIVGFGWHQGWNDIGSPQVQYETNMVNFIRDVRAEFGVPNLPFVIETTGMSSASPSQLLICAAQAAVANPVLYPELAGTVFTVDTRQFDYGLLLGAMASQGYHWYHNGESYFNIGQSMGLAMLSLINNPPQVTNNPASAIFSSSASLNAIVTWPYTPCNVTAFWGNSNGGTNPAAWDNSAAVGSWTSGILTNQYGIFGSYVLDGGDLSSVVASNVSFGVSGLTGNTNYYFTFCATNQTVSILSLTNTQILWATNVQSFTTPVSFAPVVNNGAGATNLSVGVAQLRGTLVTNGPADVRLYWGPTDGETSAAGWANAILLPNTPNSSFTASVSNLIYGLTYYYRVVGSNQFGAAWAPATTSFTTLRPASSSLANSASTGISGHAAALHATLACPEAAYQVTLFFSTVNGGTNAASWNNSVYVGSWSNVVSTNLSYPAAGLLPGTAYYFTFLATNALDTLWATNVQSFTTDKSASLTNLAPSAGTLSPAFASGTFNYTAIVPYATASLAVTPTAVDPNATIKVNGSVVTSGNPSGLIVLGVGATNVITTVVTAQDGRTTNTYTLTVTRGANAYLAGLLPSTGTLSPAFGSNTFSYTATVPFATTSLTVTPTAADANATTTVNGSPVASGSPSGNINLSVGTNVITTVVVSQDLTATNVYTMTVTRLGISYLNNLVPSAGTLAPAFAAATFSYSTIVPYATTSLTVTPTAADNNATITVNGSPVASGSPSEAFILILGANVITTVVVSADTTETNVYTLTALRAGQFWDGGTTNLTATGDGVSAGGAGTWNTTTLNWDQEAGAPHVAWNNADNNTAIFGGTAGTVTLGSGITIGGLKFDTAGYTITGNTLTFGTAGTITSVVPVGTNTISSVLAGSGAVTQTGGATLKLNGSFVNTFNGGLVLNGGVLLADFSNLGTPTDLINNSNRLTLGGGTLSIKGQSSGATSQTLNGVAVNAGGAQILGNNNSGTSTTIALGSLTATNAGGSLLVGNATTTIGNAPVITTTNASDSTGIYGGRIVFFGGTANTGYDFASTASGGSLYTLGAYAAYTTLPTAVTSDSLNVQMTAGTTLAGAQTHNSLKIGSGLTLANGGFDQTLTSGGLLSVGTVASAISGSGTLTAGNGSGSHDLIVHQYNSGGLTISAPINNNGGNAVNLVKAGTGALTLSGTNTFSGATFVNAGTLTISGGGTLGSRNYGGNISIANDGVLNFANNIQTNSGNIADNGTLAFSGSGTTVDALYVVSGNISGSGSVNFNASINNANGTLTLSGNNTYTGKTSFGPGNIISTITLSVSSFDYITSGSYANHGSGSSLGAPTTVANGTILIGVNGNGSKSASAVLKYTGPGETTDRVLTFAFSQGSGFRTIDASGSGLLKFTSPFTYTSGPAAGHTPAITLQGSGLGEVAAGITNLYAGLPVTKTGTGTWTLSGANTYSGTTTISQGALVANNNAALGTGLLTLNGGTLSNSVANIVLTNAVNLASSSSAVGVASGINLTLGGVITNTFALTKVGSGTLTLTNANTYSGTTAVNAGTLLVNGNSAAVTNVVTVLTNATFGGTGTVGGTVRYRNGSQALFVVGPDGSGYNNSNYMTFTNAAFLTNVTVRVNLPAALGNGVYVLATNYVGFTTNGTLTFATNSGSLGAGGSGVVSVDGNNLVLTVSGVGGGGSSTNAFLNSLVLTPLGTLSPSFASNVFTYTATNAFGVSPTVTVVNTDLTATNQLIYSGATNGLASGSPSSGLSLTLGVVNPVMVRVTAQDNVTVQTYTVNVTMQPSLTSPTLGRSVSGTTLSLSWPASHLGYTLQQQTNSRSIGLSTNWAAVPGSASVTSTNVTIDPTKPTTFYRLVYP